MIGSSGYITLIFTILNLGKDPAYQPLLRVPLGNTKLIRTPQQCRVVEEDALLLCEGIPGPIRNGLGRTISMDVDVSKLVGGQESLNWNNIEVFSQSDDTQDTNNRNDRINFELKLKTEADLVITTSMEPEELDIKDEETYFSREFTQTYQIRNDLTSPIKGIKTQVDIPVFYAQKEIVQFISAFIQLNDGRKFKCQEDNRNQITTIGKMSPDMPGQIDCISTPGTRCIEIK